MENLSQQSAMVVQQQQREQQIQMFWNSKLEEIKQLRDFKHHEFPISRMKKIMKSNPDVIKVTGKAPILLVKACELLIEELTLRSWLHAQGNQRQLLQKKDFADAVRQTNTFDFLVKIVTRNEIEGATSFGPGIVGSAVSGVLNSYPPMGQPAMPGVIIGNPDIPVDAPLVYVHPWLQAWEAVENYPYATGGNNGQGNLDPPRDEIEGATGFGPGTIGSTVRVVPNSYSPMGQPVVPGVIIGNPAMPVVAPSVYVHPWLQSWEAVENYPYATGGNNGQSNLNPPS